MVTEHYWCEDLQAYTFCLNSYLGFAICRSSPLPVMESSGRERVNAAGRKNENSKSQGICLSDRLRCRVLLRTHFLFTYARPGGCCYLNYIATLAKQHCVTKRREKEWLGERNRRKTIQHLLFSLEQQWGLCKIIFWRWVQEEREKELWCKSRDWTVVWLSVWTALPY